MGRYTVPLARAFVDAVGVGEGMRVLDVGCGPGGLTTEIAARGVDREDIAAIDPAPQFADACRERNPGAEVRVGVAEELPWEDDSFDAALSCLVIAFMTDPDAGLGEMARVTAPGGTVAACMWDLPSGMNMLRIFWAAMRTVGAGREGEKGRPGISEGDIAERLERAGLREISAGALTVAADYKDFDDLWEPYTLGVGPAGKALAKLDDEGLAAVREAVRAEAPSGPFSLEARAWYATGKV
jgi:SAM-dependent methyltransferase